MINSYLLNNIFEGWSKKTKEIQTRLNKKSKQLKEYPQRDIEIFKDKKWDQNVRS